MPLLEKHLSCLDYAVGSYPSIHSPLLALEDHLLRMFCFSRENPTHLHPLPPVHLQCPLL